MMAPTIDTLRRLAKNRPALFIFALAFPLLFGGCFTPRYRPYHITNEAVPVDALEVYKKNGAEVPAKIQVVNFMVNSVNANYSDADKEAFRHQNSLEIPNKLYYSLAARQAFSQVARTAVPSLASADYIVSGNYDYSDKLVEGFSSSTLSVHGALHVYVLRSKDSAVILDKIYNEDRTSSDKIHAYLNMYYLNVSYLQSAFIEPITAEIKHAVAEDLAKGK